MSCVLCRDSAGAVLLFFMRLTGVGERFFMLRANVGESLGLATHCAKKCPLWTDFFVFSLDKARPNMYNTICDIFA